MKYIQCPKTYNGEGIALFLAGGISNCPNWQPELADLLVDTRLTVLDPRREYFSDGVEEEQIKWEWEHLREASATSFWFPKETLCPITLYELGKQSVLEKPIFVGVHPEYPRRRDVEIQTALERPEVEIVYSLEDLATQIKLWEKATR